MEGIRPGTTKKVKKNTRVPGGDFLGDYVNFNHIPLWMIFNQMNGAGSSLG